MSFRLEGDELVEAKERNSWMGGDGPKVLAGGLTCLAAFLNFFGRWPRAMWALAAIAATLLMWLIGSGIRALVQRLSQKRAGTRFVTVEYPKLVQLFDRLKQFTSRDNARGFCHMLYNASSYRVDVVDQILGSDYIEGWMSCYETMLQGGCRSLPDLLARSCHFTRLAREFNSNYVIKTQKALEKNTAVPEQSLDDFEDFRERFGIYLDSVEQWAEGIVRATETRVPQEMFLRYAPQRSFQRARSFKNGSAKSKGGTA